MKKIRPRKKGGSCRKRISYVEIKAALRRMKSRKVPMTSYREYVSVRRKISRVFEQMVQQHECVRRNVVVLVFKNRSNYRATDESHSEI